MGCCGSKKKMEDSDTDPQENKQYSWDKREKVDPKQFIIDGLSDELVVRKPGSINGQQFLIQNCKNAKIYLLDHIATITVDDCIGCQIVVGPVKSSIFLRNCQECKCIVSCQQFRTRDCSKMDIFLCCSTQPIIESSSRLRFGCYQLAYDGLVQQFHEASLSLFNNNWNNVHDFTPVPESKNWITIPENIPVSDVINLCVITEDPEPGNGDAKKQEGEGSTLKLETDTSVVPLTRGSRVKNFDDSCFVVVFHSDKAREVALEIIEKLKGKAELIQTKEISLSPDEGARIFGDNSSKIWSTAKKGPVIGLEFNGDDCTSVCEQVVSEVRDDERTIYSSPSSSVAVREIDTFYNFCDMQLSV